MPQHPAGERAAWPTRQTPLARRLPAIATIGRRTVPAHRHALRATEPEVRVSPSSCGRAFRHLLFKDAAAREIFQSDCESVEKSRKNGQSGGARRRVASIGSAGLTNWSFRMRGLASRETVPAFCTRRVRPNVRRGTERARSRGEISRARQQGPVDEERGVRRHPNRFCRPTGCRRPRVSRTPP